MRLSQNPILEYCVISLFFSFQILVLPTLCHIASTMRRSQNPILEYLVIFFLFFSFQILVLPSLRHIASSQQSQLSDFRRRTEATTSTSSITSAAKHLLDNLRAPTDPEPTGGSASITTAQDPSQYHSCQKLLWEWYGIDEKYLTGHPKISGIRFLPSSTTWTSFRFSSPYLRGSVFFPVLLLQPVFGFHVFHSALSLR